MKLEPRHYTYMALCLLVSALLMAVSGCDAGDVLRVKTPQAIQQSEGLPATMTLNEAEQEYQAWFADTKRAGAQWKANIERSGEVRALLNQMTLGLLDQVGPAIGGIPVLGPMLPALTGIVGILMGAARTRKEKEASYNKGIEVGATTVRNGGSA